MVTFQLFLKDDNTYLYKYFPNGDTSKKAGILKLDTISKTISIVEIAEEDFLRVVDVEELKKTLNSLNKLSEEEGLPLISEEEFSVKDELRWYYYAEHAINCIWDNFLNNTIKEEGIVAWG